ncbi:MAG: hypothetical protein IJF60_05255 [Agathobacter sp.]|nr:hypothetical protein [Agathobacter sp.]
MKSKKSFFNKTIFKKNVTLYWPLWAVYTVFLFCMQPMMIWVYNYNANRRNDYTMTDRVRDLISSLSMEGYILLIAFFAMLFGMALFNYLYNSKSANMIHSLPVDRTELFGTNVLSGLAFLVVPQLFVAILSVFVCLGYGITKVHYLGIWLLMSMGTSFVAFAIVTFCAMFTGLLVALPAYVVILNLLSHWVYYIVYVVVTTFGYGVNNIGVEASKIAEMTSPFFCFMGWVGIYRDYDFNGNLRGIGVKGVHILCIYLLIAIVLYVLAYLIYQKRKIESAGDLITIGWVKPVFRFGVGLSGGIFGGLMLRELLVAIGIGCPLFVAIVLMLVIGALAYFAADMLIHKSFRVFKKKNWIGCGAFSIALLITFFGLYGLSNYYENYIPKEEEVLAATINMGYDVQLEGEEAKAIMEIHEAILAQKDYSENYREKGGYEYEYVSFYYDLEGKERVRRAYEIPYKNEDTRAILEMIDVLERDPENFYRNTFGKNYDDITDFGGGWVEIPLAEKREQYSDYGYDNISLNQEQAEKLYQAIFADTEDGTLMKYNVFRSMNWVSGDMLQYADTYAYLTIEYKQPYSESTTTSINMSENSIGYVEMVTAESYVNWQNAHINFGHDCENIINALIEFGIIESKWDIDWPMEIEQGEDIYLDVEAEELIQN